MPGLAKESEVPAIESSQRSAIRNQPQKSVPRLHHVSDNTSGETVLNCEAGLEMTPEKSGLIQGRALPGKYSSKQHNGKRTPDLRSSGHR
jgi:hypothetical protein